MLAVIQGPDVFIVHLDSGREMRGGQWQVLLLMQALARRGHRQQLLARSGSPLFEKARQSGFDVAALRGLMRAPRESAAADILHAHDAGAHAVAARWLLPPEFPGVLSPVPWHPPLVVSRRVAFPVRRGPLSRGKYARAVRYIAVSRYAARELEHAGISSDRIHVIWDGAALPDLASATEQRSCFRRRLNLPGDAFVAGTLTPIAEKPLAPLLEAAATRPRLQLLIASAEAHRRAPRIDLPNVQFLPRDVDISPFLFGLDAFVYLSEAEGLGSAALLAMAHGLPVIASDVGGLPEIVREGRTGLLVRNNALEVGAALERLFADRALAAALGASGRRLVQEKATDDIMAARTEQVYLQVIGGRS